MMQGRKVPGLYEIDGLPKELGHVVFLLFQREVKFEMKRVTEAFRETVYAIFVYSLIVGFFVGFAYIFGFEKFLRLFGFSFPGFRCPIVF